MNRNKPVLVTTDGSVHSHRVLPHATLLATALNVPLILLQVPDEAEADASRAREAAIATLTRLGIAGEVLVEAREGRERTAEAVLRVAERLDAAVLAIDSRGHGALRHALHGSVALEVLGAARLPLLVSGPLVELPAPEAAPYRIVATSDGSPASAAVLHALGALAGDGGFELTLLRVHEHEPGGHDNEAAMQSCRDELEAARGLLPASLSVETVVREIPRGAGVDTTIIEKAQELGAHAIAISTHGYSARRHVVMGSVALTLLGRSPLPLLLARAEV
ncbi:MAG TPA: universal stress protein [Dehalococcoidia bacterium]|nr:universal stress protein [Dehalococcoidia bacterium]